MYTSSFKFHLAVVPAVAAILWGAASTWTPAWADCCPSHKSGPTGQHQAGGSGHQHGDRQAPDTGREATAPKAAHGGQMTAKVHHRFEVVYLTKETRVYLYGSEGRPLSARSVQGEVAMRVRGSDRTFRFPLKHVALPAGSTDQDYLPAVVDVSRIRDGDMAVGFELSNLPNRREAGATFNQTFALSKRPPQVRVATLTEADRAGVARQQVCAVSGGKLGSMGTPVKVLVGDKPVYLCSQGCLGKVQQNPEFYVKKVAAAPSQPKATAPVRKISVTMATLTKADQAGITRQKVCAVSGGRLGGMGTPIKVLIGEQPVYLCCKGCFGKVQKDPRFYLNKAAQLRSGR